jgi:hypothetical protein
LTLLNYEYAVKRATGGPYYTTEIGISPRFGSPHFTNVHLVKDTHYKIALRYTQKPNQSMKVLNGILEILKDT